MSSDFAKSRAAAPPQLDWQGELDSAMADIDSRLTHPRRRASDRDSQPIIPELGDVPVTAELLDEIAWRVAEQIRQKHKIPAGGSRQSAETAAPALQPGKILMIRLKLPVLPWPFSWLQRFRKKQHPLTTARLPG